MFHQDTWDFIRKHAQDDVRKLALKRPTNPNVDLKEALVQIEGYQTARKKLPLWTENPQLVYPPRSTNNRWCAACCKACAVR